MTVVMLKQKLAIDAWTDDIAGHVEILKDRIYDQVRLSEWEAREDNMPTEIINYATVSAVSQALVQITASRNTISTEQVLEYVRKTITEDE